MKDREITIKALGEVRFEGNEDCPPIATILTGRRGHAFFSIGGYELSLDDMIAIIIDMGRRENHFKQQRIGT